MKRLLVTMMAPLVLAACGGSSDTDPAELAKRIGASRCERTNFTLESKVNGESTVIYDCYRDYQNICVTDDDDIARDETAKVTVLFANTLAADKPTCAE